MDRILDINGFKVVANNVNIRIDKMQICPAEATKLTGLVGFAGSMAGLNALPAQIADPPFKVEFSEDGNHRLTKEDGGEIIFTFTSIDSLIQAVNTAVTVSVDMQKLSPKDIPVHHGPMFPDTFEGRG